MPKISLPIDSSIEEIVSAFKESPNIILTAPPGSGKTTRIPAALLGKFKKIIVLVPKRIAAVSAASRVAEENNWTLGKEVGYQVRFENKSDRYTQLIFMTEGVFIKKLQDRHFWQNLELVVFDEFHERSSQIDLALGVTLEKQILEQHVKLLIMSATLNTAPLQKFLGEARLIEVATKPYPLEIIKSKKSQRLKVDFQFCETLIETLQAATTKAKNDILIFLPGLSEIRFVERQLQQKFRSLDIAILHGSTKLDEQRRILNGTRSTEGLRRVVLATNIAESSLTIPGVDCVIDSGLVKRSVAELKIGFKRLELARISLFSAKQRAGRAARTSPGVCYQLWHDLDERSMPEVIQPEILSSDLLEESLTLLSLDMNPDHFSWLDRPKKNFQDAVDQLKAWELVQTEKGRLVQAAPLDLERGLLFTELCLRGLQEPASRLLAYLETTNFEKLSEYPDIENLFLNEQGQKIEAQLRRLDFKAVIKKPASLKAELISIFFKDFPHRIAKRKEKTSAVSSLGRGLELARILLQPDGDYFLLLAGRELSDAVTKCEFAISFSATEFDRYGSENTRQLIETKFDVEKKRLYKVEQKVAGYFVISEAAKVFIDEARQPELFKEYFRKNFSVLLEQHDNYKNYVTKLNFLKRKTDSDFRFTESLAESVYQVISGSTHSMADFFNLNLFEILAYVMPDQIKKDMAELPGQFRLPSGKIVEIDYESEQAPKISARIQELYGQNTNPTVLNGKVRMTIELLAPNYRPTQITSQLENFWKTSYFEIKKELKARYPRHAWPDEPTTYKHEPKKK